MEPSPAAKVVRIASAWLVVLLFLFPLFWWVLASVKPYPAIFSRVPVFFDFTPTTSSYEVVLLGRSRDDVQLQATGAIAGSGGGDYFSAPALLDSLVVALGSTLIVTIAAAFAAYALSRLRFRGQQHFVFWILSSRMLPPVAAVVPLFLIYRQIGLLDTYLGLILAHTLMNLPIAVLLMKSFLDDVPAQLDEAALIDGASRLQAFRLVVLPMIKGGIAATAVLCFVFSWTEFLLALQLTATDIRTVPVASSTFVTSTGTEWGFMTALGTAALVPAFVFILLVQRHLVRGLTLGSLKE